MESSAGAEKKKLNGQHPQLIIRKGSRVCFAPNFATPSYRFMDLKTRVSSLPGLTSHKTEPATQGYPSATAPGFGCPSQCHHHPRTRRPAGQHMPHTTLRSAAWTRVCGFFFFLGGIFLHPTTLVTVTKYGRIPPQPPPQRPAGNEK